MGIKYCKVEINNMYNKINSIYSKGDLNMEIFKKISTLILSIIVFGGPQLYEVDAIEISNDLNNNIFKEIKL